MPPTSLFDFSSPDFLTQASPLAEHWWPAEPPIVEARPPQHTSVSVLCPTVSCAFPPVSTFRLAGVFRALPNSPGDHEHLTQWPSPPHTEVAGLLEISLLDASTPWPISRFPGWLAIGWFVTCSGAFWV